jgi:hypothetical protein
VDNIDVAPTTCTPGPAPVPLPEGIPAILSAARLCRLLRITPATLWRRVEAGAIPPPARQYRDGRSCWRARDLALQLQDLPPPRQPRPPGLLTRHGVARLLGIGNVRLKALRRRGLFPAPDAVLEGRPFWKPETIEAIRPSLPSMIRRHGPDPEAWKMWQPTEASPGSAGKVAVLAERARLRLPLFHPQDFIETEDETPHNQPRRNAS